MTIFKKNILFTVSALLLATGVVASPAMAFTNEGVQPSPASASVAQVAIKFPDVNSGNAFSEEIYYLSGKGIIKGYPDGKFYPKASIKRIDAVRMIIREMNPKDMSAPNPRYSDMNPKSPGYAEFAKAVEIGFISGKVKADGTKYFDPNATMTRAEMAKILVEGYPNNLAYDGNKTFRDVSSKHWAKSYISRLATGQITRGHGDGTFKPNDDLSREHFSAFMARLLSSNFIPMDDSDEELVPYEPPQP